jgi:hypothetical protein
VLLLFACLLLAGCASPAPGPAPAPRAPSASAAAAPDANATPATTTLTRVPLRLDGSLGLGAWACVFQPVSACPDPTYAVQPARTELRVEGQRGVVAAAHVTLTWTASTPATAQLGMGLMSMGPRACNCTVMIGNVVGPSPLTIDAPRAGAPLPAGSVLHLFVYETTEEANDAAYAYAEAPQDVHAEGWADVALTR